MAQQIRDAQISVKLDVEEAQKQAKSLEKKVAQDGRTLNQAEEKEKKVRRGAEQANETAKEGAPGVINKARRFGYRGVAQAPDFARFQIEGTATGISIFNDTAANLYRTVAPFAERGEAYLKGAVQSVVDKTPEALRGVAEEASKDPRLWGALEAQAKMTREMQMKTAAIDQALTGTTGIALAGGQSGLPQSPSFLRTVIEGEFKIGEMNEAISQKIRNIQKEWMAKNLGSATMDAMFGSKGVK